MLVVGGLARLSLRSQEVEAPEMPSRSPNSNRLSSIPPSLSAAPAMLDWFSNAVETRYRPLAIPPASAETLYT